MARHRIRRTKLVATIGPSCDSPEAIKAMIRAGMDVARLNFSHGSHEEHRKRLSLIREASRELGANVAIMLDTKGVKIRTGRLAGGSATLETGATFTLYTDGRIGDARGSPTKPLSDREIEAKVRDLAAFGCPSLDVEPLIAAIWALDRSEDAGAVMALACPR